MLSTTYHLAYWAVALIAAAIHRLLLLLVPGAVLANRIVFVPLLVYTTYVSSEWHRSPKTKATLQFYIHQVAVAYLLVALGSVVEYYQIPGDLPKPTLLIHVLLAFMAVGNLECLRQNRKDIEPRVFWLCLSGPRTKLVRSNRMLESMAEQLFFIFPLCAVILFFTLRISDEALSRFWGMSLTHVVPLWPLPHTGFQVKGRLGSAMVSMILLGSPFTDICETLYYVIARRIVPERRGWVPTPQALIEEHTLHPLLALDISAGVFAWPICAWIVGWLG